MMHNLLTSSSVFQEVQLLLVLLLLLLVLEALRNALYKLKTYLLYLLTSTTQDNLSGSWYQNVKPF